MNGAFYIGATGLSAQQKALDVVANNIANINTTAFKRSQASFLTLVTPPDPQDGANGQNALSGVVVGSSPIVWTEGSLQQTRQPLDIAIDGNGLIALMGPGGQTLLWRGGTLQVNADGYLAGPNGLPLKQMISVPSGMTALAIGADGKVQATVSGDATPVDLGQIDLVKAKDPGALAPHNGGLYQVDDDSQLITAAPGTEGLGTLASGSLESSNADLSDEMTTLLLLQRAYGANAEVVQAGDQLMSIANSLKR
jgi:flagellar basal-body rod protein FlgG